MRYCRARVYRELYISKRSFGSNLSARGPAGVPRRKYLATPRRFTRSRKVAETKVRTHSWSSDGCATRRQEIILDQICRAFPRGKAKSRAAAVTEISQKWFSHGVPGELCYSRRRIRGSANRSGGFSPPHCSYHLRAREWIYWALTIVNRYCNCLRKCLYAFV